MDKLVEQMYRDAMVIEDIYSLTKEAALTNGGRIGAAWARITDGLRGLVLHLGEIDVAGAQRLLEVWRETGENETDFRNLAAKAEHEILPLVQGALRRLYPPINTMVGKWEFEQTPIGFFTVKDAVSGRYIHNPYDPMREAALLAEEIYVPDADEFCILGCGLGYLAYQLWRKSEKALHICIFEEDEDLLRMARGLGVLDWIDEGDISIASHDATERMLEKFLEKTSNSRYGYYVQDWKRGCYTENRYGQLIDQIDFNKRTSRINRIHHQNNIRINQRRELYPIESLSEAIKKPTSVAAVVSAGPSLNDSIDFLKMHMGELLIIAGNTTLRRLESEGIRPDIITMLDPLPTLGGHLDGIEDFTEGIPLVTVRNGSYTFVEKYRGRIYLAPDDAEVSEDTYLWSFAGTVASLSVDVACYLGARTVYLIGSDLGYPGGVNYADGLVHGKTAYMREGDEITVESVDGTRIRTSPLYREYIKMIEQQIRIHPRTVFYNLSKHGAKIQGANIWTPFGT